MGYNRENYARIRGEYQIKYLKARAEADRRMEEVHAKSPELAAIDRELARTGAEIAMAAIGTGEDYRAKLTLVEEELNKNPVNHNIYAVIDVSNTTKPIWRQISAENLFD
jgi:hypothetical protein